MRRLSDLIYMFVLILFSYSTLSFPGVAASDDHPHTSPQACDTPLFENLGSLEFPVTTADALAQAYFNQGMILTYGFNHPEALRAFRKAQSLDPNCAMCFWGEALALGPNINKPIEAEDGVLAAKAVAKALSMQSLASAKEAALISALSTRYSADGDGDRAVMDARYATAMADLYKKYRDDAHIGTLYAESLMDLSPWSYWNIDGSYGPHTEEMISVLQAVLEKQPDHPGANHFLIHVVESARPELGLDAANRLRDLVPGAGHLQHMPAHIYLRLGKYRDAVTANLKGIAADKAYLAGCHAAGFYPMMYVPHNYDFLITAASLAGKSELALKTAAELREYSLPFLQQHPLMYDNQAITSALLLTRVRFTKWDSVLAEPKPDGSLLLSTALWHYARAVAYAHSSRFAESAQEVAALKEIAAKPELGTALLMGVNTVAKVLAIAAYEAEGILAAKVGQLDKSERLLRLGVQEQDSLIYMEPPPWYRSVRLVLGKTLLESGKYVDAQKVFEADLQRFPENGYSLYGLFLSLMGQNRDKEASEVYGRYVRAFEGADFKVKRR